MNINRPPFPPIPYGERPGSPEESFVNGTARVKRVVDLEWEDRWDAAACFIGFASRKKSAGGLYYVSRSIPDQYPDALLSRAGTGDNWLWASQVERIEGVGPVKKDNAGIVNVFAYNTARLSILYESFTYAVVPDNFPGLQVAGVPDESTLVRYVTKSIQPTAEFLTLPYGTFRFVDAARSPVVGSNGRLLSSQEIQYTWHQVPGTPTGFGYVGTVNNDTFDGYAAGTLLLTAAERKPWRQIDGTLVFDYTYKVKYFEPEAGKGHNYFLQYLNNATPDTATYQYTKITSTGLDGGKTVYATNTFPNLFRLN